MTTTIDCALLDSALDHGIGCLVWLRMSILVDPNKGPKFYQARRNGRTRTWKRKPNQFAIPVKAGLRTTTHITQYSLIAVAGEEGWQRADVVISPFNPATLYKLSNFHVNGLIASQMSNSKENV